MKKKFIILFIVIIILLGGYFILSKNNAETCFDPTYTRYFKKEEFITKLNLVESGHHSSEDITTMIDNLKVISTHSSCGGEKLLKLKMRVLSLIYDIYKVDQWILPNIYFVTDLKTGEKYILNEGPETKIHGLVENS